MNVMKLTFRTLGAAAAIVLRLVPGAMAQTTGRIEGRVVDASDSVVPGGDP